MILSNQHYYISKHQQIEVQVQHTYDYERVLLLPTSTDQWYYINRSQRQPSSQSYTNGSTTHQYASGLGQIVHLAVAAENSRRLEAWRRLQAVGSAVASHYRRRRWRRWRWRATADGGGSPESALDPWCGRGLLGSLAAALGRLACVPGVSRACPGRIGIFSSFFKSKNGILLGYPYLSHIWRIGDVLYGDTKNSDVSVLRSSSPRLFFPSLPLAASESRAAAPLARPASSYAGGGSGVLAVPALGSSGPWRPAAAFAAVGARDLTPLLPPAWLGRAWDAACAKDLSSDEIPSRQWPPVPTAMLEGAVLFLDIDWSSHFSFPYVFRAKSLTLCDSDGSEALS